MDVPQRQAEPLQQGDGAPDERGGPCDAGGEVADALQQSGQDVRHVAGELGPAP